MEVQLGLLFFNKMIKQNKHQPEKHDGLNGVSMKVYSFEALISSNPLYIYTHT